MCKPLPFLNSTYFELFWIYNFGFKRLSNHNFRIISIYKFRDSGIRFQIVIPNSDFGAAIPEFDSGF